MFGQKRVRPEMDMCNGPTLGNLIRFSIPLMVSGILQLLYNAADMAVVGQFAGKEALAAVGSTGSLINLIVTLFIGLSTGASIVVARCWGARDHQGVTQAVHTAITVACVSSLFLMGVGIAFSPTFLGWMGTPDDVMPGASLYMRIYFAGMPFNLLYNFGSAILRAVGDTKRPLYFLTVSGLINVLLNLLFVIGFGMAVDGVALATVISQVVSAVLVLLSLLHANSSIRLQPKMLCIHKAPLLEMVRIGLPSGMNGAMFSIANVLIQSTINSFGSIAMAGNAAACNLEGFIWTAMNAVYQADMTFTSQNIGARKPERVRRIGWQCFGIVVDIGIVLGIILYFFGPQLLTIYNSDPAVIEMGMVRIRITAFFCFAAGGMDAFAYHLRGMGLAIFPMVTSLMGVCVFRIAWLYTFFAANPTLGTLFWSYPISWLLTMAFLCVANAYVTRTVLPKKMAAS